MSGLFSSGDVQVKSMEQVLNHGEKHLGQICSLLSSYTRKTARLRDKADLLVLRLFDFSATEGPELQLGLKNLAEDLAMVQDYRQAQIERLESRVVAPLRAYGDIIKSQKADVKRLNTELSREVKQQQKLDRLRLKNPADRQTIAEVNAQKASNNALRILRQGEDAITDFQGQKLHDIKRIFTEFITVEMLFHAKALEVYTHTSHNLEAMDLEKDLELFNGRIQMSDSLVGHLETIPPSRHSSPLTSRLQSPAGTRTGQNLILGPRSRRHHNQSLDRTTRSRSLFRRQRGMEEEVEEEEEEEQEEEEEEEEEDQSGPEEAEQSSRPSYAAQYARVRRRIK